MMTEYKWRHLVEWLKDYYIFEYTDIDPNFKNEMIDYIVTHNAEVFTKIFTEKSQAEFIRIAQLYYKLTKKTILQAVEKEFSGDCKEALIGIIYAMLSPAEYFAKKVYKAVKGLGTDNTTLIRILITRDEKDMPQIKQFFKQLYKKDMLEAVKDDTSGNYQKILIELASH